MHGRPSLISGSVMLSWNPTGPTRTRTPTPTSGMRLSCNFVNVYTIVYHVQYTYTCRRAHPQRTSSRGKARVSDKSPRTRLRGSSYVSGSWRADARKSVSESMSVSVPWNLGFTVCCQSSLLLLFATSCYQR